MELFWGGRFYYNLRRNGYKILQECQKAKDVYDFLWFCKSIIAIEAMALAQANAPLLIIPIL